MCNGRQVVDRIGSTLLTFPDNQFSRKMKRIRLKYKENDDLN